MAPVSTIKVWYLFISEKTNHTTYSNQSNHKSCLISFHQLIIPAWIRYQTYVSKIWYRGEYHKQCIAIWIVSWPSVSLHPYHCCGIAVLMWYILIALENWELHLDPLYTHKPCLYLWWCPTLSICYMEKLESAGGVHGNQRWLFWFYYDIDGLVQERCNSSALAKELHLSCTIPSICTIKSSKTFQMDFRLNGKSLLLRGSVLFLFHIKIYIFHILVNFCLYPCHWARV